MCTFVHTYAITSTICVVWASSYAISLYHKVLGLTCLFTHVLQYRCIFSWTHLFYTHSLSDHYHVAANVHACLYTSSVLALPCGSRGMHVLICHRHVYLHTYHIPEPFHDSTVTCAHTHTMSPLHYVVAWADLLYTVL